MDGMRSDALANRRDLVSAASGLLAEQGAGMSLRAVAQASSALEQLRGMRPRSARMRPIATPRRGS